MCDDDITSSRQQPQQRRLARPHPTMPTAHKDTADAHIARVYIINAAAQLGRWTHMQCGDVMQSAAFRGVPVQRF